MGWDPLMTPVESYRRYGKRERTERKGQLLNLQDLQIYVYVWGGALAPWAASTGLDRPEQCPLPPLGGAPVEKVSVCSIHCMSLAKFGSNFDFFPYRKGSTFA